MPQALKAFTINPAITVVRKPSAYGQTEATYVWGQLASYDKQDLDQSS